jgi:FAD/FMN-containing dehydrogenase
MPTLQPTQDLQSWGRIGRPLQYRLDATQTRDLAAGLALAQDQNLSTLAVGLGRSYGDSGQNHGHAIITTLGLDRLIAFDRQSGVLRAQAGLSLGDALAIIVPHGWFLPTTPGSRFVTLGGAVANDVHGKNHHSQGTFGASVTAIGLIRSDIGAVELSPSTHPELFAATIGGLGLTGLIAWVEVKLTKISSAYLDEETIPFDNLDGYFELAQASSERFEHCVSWIDCTANDRALGRGIFTRAKWRSDGKLDCHSNKPRATMPMDAPNWALNPLTLKLFNTFYFGLGKRNAGTKISHYGSCFYPLDAIGNWNRLYGARGFYQYQCVVPALIARDAIGELLREIARSGQGSFLAVLKSFGAKASPGLLSFPMPGVTLALDFPNCGDATLALFERLDAIVRQSKGRLYCAKDGRMPAAMFKQGYEHALNQFMTQCDPALGSSFWRRIHHV